MKERENEVEGRTKEKRNKRGWSEKQAEKGGIIHLSIVLSSNGERCHYNGYLPQKNLPCYERNTTRNNSLHSAVIRFNIISYIR